MDIMGRRVWYYIERIIPKICNVLDTYLFAVIVNGFNILFK